ncbi:site-specific DNA-methyltransferase [Gloeocapsopsis crepidinum LEGE 06123]|uniref:Methyltransferase n=2 Tax=Gloeocapsopsis crepidinum TaxID=693223 RepID=A0ABR9USZ4_9CHRO|nr:site-specific DNA-methyltransferase [Gloeocapsopsis crepidinum LEGE 06123]
MVLPAPLYTTSYGAAYVGDSLVLLDQIETDSIDLVLTSPPFALQRQKTYGNVEQADYVEWLFAFCKKIYRVLSPTGSFVLDLGGAYQSKRPVRSLYNYQILLKLCDELDFRLAQEFFWFNPAKLPSPIEWVNKRKIRAKDAVNTVWWLSKIDNPKANVSNVLVPYSERMKKLHTNPQKYYKPQERPSGHNISKSFATDNGGAIPSNLLEIPNTESNSQYIQLCKSISISPHPARFPQKLPMFFINFLTEPGDTVLDIFAGSNTTGFVAEELERKWIAFEEKLPYLAASAFRFLGKNQNQEILNLYNKLLCQQESISITNSQHFVIDRQVRYLPQI